LSKAKPVPLTFKENERRGITSYMPYMTYTQFVQRKFLKKSNGDCEVKGIKNRRESVG